MRQPGKLRFLMVTTYFPPYHFGGDAIYVYRLSQALAELGHQVDVVYSVDAYKCLGGANPELSFPDHPNVTRFPLESSWPSMSAVAAHQLGRPALYAKRIETIINGGKHDVINYHNVSLVGAPKLFRLGRAVKVYTPHDYWLVCPTHVLFAFNREACVKPRCAACVLYSRRPLQLWRYTAMIEECVREIDCFLMPSEFAKERYLAGGINRPMEYLPGFVPPAEDGPGLEGEPGVPDRPYFIFAGRLEKLKGVQDLIALFREYRQARLVIAGSGSFEGTLRDQARESPGVSFIGNVHPSALNRLYRGAVAVLVPSICYETFGLSAVEALMCGTPVIARRTGALKEIVDRSEGGYLFDTLEELMEAMEKLRTQPDLRKKMGQNGRNAAMRLWSSKTYIERYLDIVTSLMDGKKTCQLGAAAQDASAATLGT